MGGTIYCQTLEMAVPSSLKFVTLSIVCLAIVVRKEHRGDVEADEGLEEECADNCCVSFVLCWVQ